MPKRSETYMHVMSYLKTIKTWAEKLFSRPLNYINIEKLT